MDVQNQNMAHQSVRTQAAALGPVAPVLRESLLRLPRVSEAVDLGASTIRTMVAEGEFPRPIRIGKRAVAWLQSDIDRWLADRAAERDAAMSAIDFERIKREAAAKRAAAAARRAANPEAAEARRAAIRAKRAENAKRRAGGKGGRE